MAVNATDIKIEKSWKNKLKDEFAQEYFQELTDFVRAEYKSKTVFPPPKDIFNAFEHCGFDDVKVVILGQDPYHNPNQAHGLAFSVAPGVTIPPSLQNIYKEIHSDIAQSGREDWLLFKEVSQRDGDLTHWAEQGVLLLNATLTVVKNSPGSHQGKGWERFTDAVVKLISEEKKNVVFLLWGKYAIERGMQVDMLKHKILTAPHPSPFSANRGFFGCRHFSQTNEYLESVGKEPIVW